MHGYEGSLPTNNISDRARHPMKAVNGGLIPDFRDPYLTEDIPNMVVVKG
jgi:hypothetical protein